MSNKNVLPLKIKIITNNDKTPFELKYSKIYNPLPEDRPRRILISDYPYFTADVRYDEKLLASKTYSEILNIFFDKQEFIKVIMQFTPDKSEQENKLNTQMDIANENVMTMLRLLFPTNYPTKNNINTSLKKYFLKKGPTRTFDIGDVKNIFSYGKPSVKAKHNYSYLKTDKGIFTVSEVIWLNDVINNELYRELINQLIKYNDWRKEQTKLIGEEIKDTTDQLQNGLTPLGEETGTGELVIDKTAKDDLASQKRIYNPDDIKADMMNIIKKHVIISAGKETIFNEKLKQMAEYFIDIYLKDTRANPITQFVRFKEKFNFEYYTQSYKESLFELHKRYDGKDRQYKIGETNRNMEHLTTKLNTSEYKDEKYKDEEQNIISHIADNKKILKILEQPLEEAFVFEGEEDTSKVSIDELKKENDQIITKIQEEIFKYVITRYNRFQEIKRSPELSGQYSELDNEIDKIIDEIDKLNALAKSPFKTVDQILNITEPLINSFEKIKKTGKISISRKIGEKLAQIIKLSNKIKFLNELQTIFFREPATGIFVDYEKTLDANDSLTKLVIEELKQEKYSNLKKIIEFIKDKFIKNKVVSLNDKLEKLIRDYFENKNNGFYDQVVEPANKLLNLGEKQDFNYLKQIWDVSVTLVKESSTGSEYNISLYMDIIEGEVNETNQSEIKCQYLDEELVKRYEELTEDRPLYTPDLNTKVFSLKKAKEEKKQREEKRKKTIEEALKNKINPNIENPNQKGGKIFTKSLKTKTKKLRQTRKKTL